MVMVFPHALDTEPGPTRSAYEASSIIVPIFMHICVYIFILRFSATLTKIFLDGLI